MKPGRQFAIVLVTAPDTRTAEKIAQTALIQRLIACANLVPKIKSYYWWRGKIDTSNEVLVVLKTTASRLRALEKLIVAQHPYDTPEFVVLRVDRGNQKYLSWLFDSVN